MLYDKVNIPLNGSKKHIKIEVVNHSIENATLWEVRLKKNEPRGQ